MNFTKKCFVSIAMICLSLGALAQTQKSIIPELSEVSRKGDMARLEQQKKKANFDMADENKNGVLSREEVAKHFSYIDQNFSRYDLDKDGTLSWVEFGGREK